MVTNREKEILDIIEQKPLISQEELAENLGISRSGVAAHIHNLTQKGFIKGRGYILQEPKFVTVIGGINMDIIGVPKSNLIENNSNPGKISYSLGGAGRNIALSLNKLDISNYFISIYGSDMYGERFEFDANLNEMNITCCQKVDDAQTSSFLSVYDENRERYFGVDDMDIYRLLTPKLIEKHLNRINNSEYCIIDANLPEETIDYLIENTDTPIVAKTVSLNKNKNLMNYIDKLTLLVTTPNELKKMLADVELFFEDESEAIKRLINSGLKNIILFSEKDGISFYNETQTISISKDHKVYGTSSGASASVTSAVVWGLYNNLSWKYIIELAYAAALITFESSQAVNEKLTIDYLFDKHEELFSN